jgi:uncharacterized protein
LPHFLSPLVARPGETFGLVNARTGEVVASTLEAALDSCTRRRGLLSRDLLPDGHGIVLAPCAAVHTFFMNFAIDVVFVARDGEVVKIVDALRPWRMAAAWRAFAALELSAGAARAARTVAGDRLRLEPGENLSPVRPQSGLREPRAIESDRAR